MSFSEKFKEFFRNPKCAAALILFIIFSPFLWFVLKRRGEDALIIPDPVFLHARGPLDLDVDKIARFAALTSRFEREYVISHLPGYTTQFAKDVIAALYEISKYHLLCAVEAVKADLYDDHIYQLYYSYFKSPYKSKLLKPYFRPLLKPALTFWKLRPFWPVGHVYTYVNFDGNNLTNLLKAANWLKTNHDDIFQKFLQKCYNRYLIINLINISSLFPGKSKLVWNKTEDVKLSDMISKEFPDWKKKVFIQSRKESVSDLPKSHSMNSLSIASSGKPSVLNTPGSGEWHVLLRFVHENSDFYACHEMLYRLLLRVFPNYHSSLTWYAVFDSEAFKAFISAYLRPTSPQYLYKFLRDLWSPYSYNFVRFIIKQQTEWCTNMLSGEYFIMFLNFESPNLRFISKEFSFSDDPIKRLFELTGIEETTDTFIEFDFFWRNSPRKDTLTKLFLINLYTFYLNSLTIDPAKKELLNQKLRADRFLLISKPDSFSSKYLFEGTHFGPIDNEFTPNLSQINYYDLSTLIKYFIERGALENSLKLRGAQILCDHYEKGTGILKKLNLDNNNTEALSLTTYLTIVIPDHTRKNLLEIYRLDRLEQVNSSERFSIIDRYCKFSTLLSQILSPAFCLAGEFRSVFHKYCLKDFKRFILSNGFTWRAENYELIRQLLELAATEGSSIGLSSFDVEFYTKCFILLQFGATLLAFNSEISVYSKNRCFFTRLLELSFDDETSLQLLIDSIIIDYDECVKLPNLKSLCFETLTKLIHTCKVREKVREHDILYASLVYVKTFVSVRNFYESQLESIKIVEMQPKPGLFSAAESFITHHRNRVYRLGKFMDFYYSWVKHSQDDALVSDLRGIFRISTAPFVDRIYSFVDCGNLREQLKEKIKNFIKEVEGSDFPDSRNEEIRANFADLQSFFEQNIKLKCEAQTGEVELKKTVKKMISQSCFKIIHENESPQEIRSRFDKYARLANLVLNGAYNSAHFELKVKNHFTSLECSLIEKFHHPQEREHLINSLEDCFFVVKSLNDSNHISSESNSLLDFWTKVVEFPNISFGLKVLCSLLRIFVAENYSSRLARILEQCDDPKQAFQITPIPRDQILKEFEESKVILQSFNAHFDNIFKQINPSRQPLQKALSFYYKVRKETLNCSLKKEFEPRRLNMAYAVVCHYDEDFPKTADSITHVWEQLFSRLQKVLDAITIDEEASFADLFRKNEKLGWEAKFLWDICRKVDPNLFYNIFGIKEDSQNFRMSFSNPSNILAIPPGIEREKHIMKIIKSNFLCDEKDLPEDQREIPDDRDIDWPQIYQEGNKQAKLDKEYEAKKAFLLNELINGLRKMIKLDTIRFVAQKLVDLRKTRPDLHLRMLDLGVIKLSFNCTVQEVIFLSTTSPNPLNGYPLLLDGNFRNIPRCFIDFIEQYLVHNFISANLKEEKELAKMYEAIKNLEQDRADPKIKEEWINIREAMIKDTLKDLPEKKNVAQVIRRKREEILIWLKSLCDLIGSELVQENEFLDAYSKFTDIQSVKNYLHIQRDKLDS